MSMYQRCTTTVGHLAVRTRNAELQRVLHDLGSDALGLCCDELLAILGASRKQLKVALMDQSLLAASGTCSARRSSGGPDSTRPVSPLPQPRRGEAVVHCRTGRPGGVG